MKGEAKTLRERAMSSLTSRPLRTKLALSHLLVAVGTMVFFVLMTLAYNPEFAGFLRQGGSIGAVVPYVVLAGVVSGVFATAASLFVSGRITRPVTRMLTATRLISAGKYDRRVPKFEDDELGSLSESMNTMAETLERTERQRSEFLSDVSHELKTPLATFQGYIEGLVDGVVEPSERTWEVLYAESERMRRLVEDLRQLSSAESDTLPLKPAPTAPASIVDSAAEGMRPLFADKGVSLETPAGDASEIPDVFADGGRVAQVMTNLLSNALRHTPEGGAVRVGLRVGEGEVAFAVADSGEGVPAGDIPRLFDRFYRVEKSRSRGAGGSGIGLAISRALIEAMGGAIRVESAGAGRGATFEFTLPTADPPR